METSTLALISVEVRLVSSGKSLMVDLNKRRLVGNAGSWTGYAPRPGRRARPEEANLKHKFEIFQG
jgi:hypothetical protein